VSGHAGDSQQITALIGSTCPPEPSPAPPALSEGRPTSVLAQSLIDGSSEMQRIPRYPASGVSRLALPVTTDMRSVRHSKQQPISLRRSDFDVRAHGERASRISGIEEKPMSVPISTVAHDR
jgi:hypothetical protein